MQTLLTAIEESNDSTELDCLFCILRDRKVGIMKKLLCFCLVLGLEESDILNEAPKDANGRILDHQSRHIIAESLVKASQKHKN